MDHDATISESVRRRAAADAGCHPKTIDKVAKGEPVKGIVAERARAALVALGIEPPPLARWRPGAGRGRP